MVVVLSVLKCVSSILLIASFQERNILNTEAFLFWQSVSTRHHGERRSHQLHTSTNRNPFSQSPQLRPVSIEPRNTRSNIAQWLKFSGLVAALSQAFRRAGQWDLCGLGSSTWNYVAIGYPALIALAGIFYFFAFGSMGGSGHKVAKSMGGIPCPPNSRIDVLLDEVYTFTNQLGKRPSTYLIPTPEPNAFAAGSSTDTVVAVTQGLLDKLSDNQLRAVLAHEVAHLRNSDTRQSMQLAAMIAALGAAKTVGSFLLQQSKQTRKKKDDEKDNLSPAMYRGIGYILFGTGLVTVMLGSLLRLGSSRTAEFAADAFAKDIGIGEDLASGLEIISQTNAASTKPRGTGGLGLASGAFSHLYIDNPPNLESSFVNMFGLLRTHPSTKDRVARLRS